MRRGLCLLWQVLVLVAYAADGVAAQTLVDVNAVVCDGGPGEVMVPLSVSNVEEPHIITLWRTSMTAVTLTLKLTSANDPNLIVVPEVTVTLENQTQRRLQVVVPSWRRPALWRSKAQAKVASPVTAGDEVHASCEAAFLFDGRDPVELPDTWRAARDDFIQLCEAELGYARDCASRTNELFWGSPDDDQPFRPSTSLCQSLIAFIQEEVVGGAELFSGRRLKSSGSSGGGLSRGYTPRSQAGGTGTSYGYSSSGLSAVYPAGYRQVAYGYSGRHIFLGVAAGVFVTHVYYSPLYRHSRVYTKAANSTDSSAPPASGQEMRWETTEEFVRDDLMETGFYPDQVNEDGAVADFRLVISYINGSDYQRDRICPPANWSIDNQGGWLAPDSQDLFVALTEVDAEEVDVAMICGAVFGSLGSVCCTGIAFLLWRRRRRYKRYCKCCRRQARSLEPVTAANASIVREAPPVAAVVTGTVVMDPGCGAPNHLSPVLISAMVKGESVGSQVSAGAVRSDDNVLADTAI